MRDPRDNDDEPTHNVALFGITGALGRELLAELEVDHEGIEDLFAVAGVRTAGQPVRWQGKNETVRSPADVPPSDVDFALFATPSEVVAREAPRLLTAGARVLDASGVLATAPAPKPLTAPAPLAWPRLSGYGALDLEAATALALPSAIASTVAPLLDAVTLAPAGLPKLESVAVTALLPASHAGREGIEALSKQSVGLLSYQSVIEPRPFPAVLAFNAVAPPLEAAVVIEDRAAAELRRLVPAIGLAPVEITPIWIAAFSGLVATVSLRFAADVDPAALARVLDAHPDLERTDEAGQDAGDAHDADDPHDEGDAHDPHNGSHGRHGADADPDDDDPTASRTAGATEAGALSLREVLDSDSVRFAMPLLGPKSARIVLMADPLHRTAVAASTLLARWIAALA